MLFYTEIRDKAKTGRGIHNRASRKKGYKGGIRFPSDNLSARERKKLNGVVIVSNVYDVIKSYEDWKALNDEDRVLYLTKWVERHGTGKIAEVWQKPSRVYDNMRKYGIVNPTGRGGARKPRAEKEVALDSIKQSAEELVRGEAIGVDWEAEARRYGNMYNEKVEQNKSLMEMLEALRHEREQGTAFKLTLNGNMQGEEIYNRLYKFLDLIEKEGNYRVDFKLEELSK